MTSGSKIFPIKLLLPLLNAAVLGSLFGAMNLFIDFQNNAEGEYYVYETGTVDWAHTAIMFLWWSVPIIVAMFVVEAPFHLYLPFPKPLLYRTSDSQAAPWKTMKVSDRLRDFLQTLVMPALDATVLGLLAGALGVYLHLPGGRNGNHLEFGHALSVFLNRSAPVVRFVFIAEALLYHLVQFLNRKTRRAD